MKLKLHLFTLHFLAFRLVTLKAFLDLNLFTFRLASFDLFCKGVFILDVLVIISQWS